MTKDKWEQYTRYEKEKQYLENEIKRLKEIRKNKYQPIREEFLNVLISTIQNEIEVMTIKQGEL